MLVVSLSYFAHNNLIIVYQLFHRFLPHSLPIQVDKALCSLLKPTYVGSLPLSYSARSLTVPSILPHLMSPQLIMSSFKCYVAFFYRLLIRRSLRQ